MRPAQNKYFMSANGDAYERFVLNHLQHFACRENTSHRNVFTSSQWRDCYNNVDVDNNETNHSITVNETQDPVWRKQLSIHLSQALKTQQLVLDFDGGRPKFKLREPRDLFTFPSSCYPFQGVRWPLECEVIDDIIHHTEWDPVELEPFYQPTGHEGAPILIGEEKGDVVYCIDLATKKPYFTCSRIGGSRGPIKSTTACAISQEESALDFESRFESGNLQKAIKVGAFEYELTLRADLYTSKHTQWFYFRVRNMRAGATYRFTIVNLMKGRSLYSLGMRPLLYSERASKETGVGWHRIGSNIKYYRNCVQNKEENISNYGPALYSLTWTIQFPYDSDTCYLAHCYPYTYSRLQQYLSRVTSDPVTTAYCNLRVLCHSLAGNPVHVLTITSPGSGWAEGRTKKAVVVTARVHPGETNGSWMMEGFLDFLLGDSDDAQLLRDTFVFKVVPMLNPDGVVVGNYRCSLAGRDLNRNYRTMLKNAFPCVWHTRNMVKRLIARMDVVLYCDFHGHSRKNNVFMYGCNSRDNASLQLHERVFPLMMSKNAKDKFSFRSCKFRVQKSKEGTGRIVMWRLGIRNSYTMESTFGGSTLGSRSGTHFSTRDLKSLGYYFCDTLLDYCDPDPTKTAYCLTELTALLRQGVRKRFGQELGSSICVSDLESSTSGSDSSESDGLPLQLLNQSDAVHEQGNHDENTAKKHLRTRRERNRLHQEKISKITDIDLSTDDTVKERNQEKMVERNKTKGSYVVEANSLIGKPAFSRPATDVRNMGHVTLWEDEEPVKNHCLDAVRASYVHRRNKAYPQLSTSATVAPCTVEADKKWGRPSCSTKLLYLSALLQPRTHTTEAEQQQLSASTLCHKGLRGRQQTSRAQTAYRSHSGIQFKVVPEILSIRGTEPCTSKPSSAAKSKNHGVKGTLMYSGMHLSDQRQAATDCPPSTAGPDQMSFLRGRSDVTGYRPSDNKQDKEERFSSSVSRDLLQVDLQPIRHDTLYRPQMLGFTKGTKFTRTLRESREMTTQDKEMVKRKAHSAITMIRR